MSERPSRRRTARIRPRNRARFELIQLESRIQPALAGLSATIVQPIEAAPALIATVSTDLPDAITLPPAASANGPAATHAHGLAGSAEAPGLTVAAEVASPHSAVSQVLGSVEVDVQFSTNVLFITVSVTPPAAAHGLARAAEVIQSHETVSASDVSDASSGEVPSQDSAPPTAKRPSVVPQSDASAVTSPTTTSVTATPVTPAAVAGVTLTGTAPTTRTPVTAATTTPFVLVPQAVVFTGGQTAGGGGTGVNLIVGPVGAATGAAGRPTGAINTTGVPAGVAVPENGKTTEPPVVTPEEEGADPAPAAEQALEPPITTSRLSAIIIGMAAAFYGFWYWRRRSVKSGHVGLFHLTRRGTARV